MTRLSDRGQRRPAGPVRIAFYWGVKAIAWLLTRIWVRLKVAGKGNVPSTGPCIVVANHTSYADAAVLGSACPRRLTFLMTRHVYKVRATRWFYYMMGAIPVALAVSDPGALKAALKRLREGGAIGIFPEGQRMPSGVLGPGKPGVAALAARTGVAVIPAAILGAHEAMPIGAIIPRPREIRVVFGAPFHFPQSAGRKPVREDLDRFAERVIDEIRALMPREDAADGAHPGISEASGA